MIINEKEYALKLLQNGFIRENKELKDIFILAKYFKNQGLSQFQTCKEIIRFINKYYDPIYSELKYWLKKSAIKRVVTVYSKNYKLRSEINIELSENELKEILKLKTIGEKQVMFVLLVLSKFFKNSTGIFYATFKDIFSFTKLSYQTKNINKILNGLVSNNYISVINKHKKAVITKLWHISKNKKIYFKINVNQDNNIIYVINNFDNLMSDFAKCMNLIDGGTYCIVCGKPIKRTSNRRKYCSNCWKEYRRKYKTEKQRMYRKM